MRDIIDELGAVHRATGNRPLSGGSARTVVLRRRYGAPVEDVWDAITSPERIRRWFLPVSGDFRVGGHFQLEGNAGGEIMRCDRPHLLVVTWAFGDTALAGASEVTVRLTPGDAEDTTFELEHAAVTDPARWARYGPGAVGVGWDMALLGLSLHLAGESIEDPAAWERSAEAAGYLTRSASAWGDAMAAAGGDPTEVATATANTTRFYVPEPGTGS